MAVKRNDRNNASHLVSISCGDVNIEIGYEFITATFHDIDNKTSKL